MREAALENAPGAAITDDEVLKKEGLGESAAVIAAARLEIKILGWNVF